MDNGKIKWKNIIEMVMILSALDVYLEGINLHKDMYLLMDVMWRTILQIVNGRLKAQRELFRFVFICIL